MKLRFVKRWRSKREGETADLPDGVANLLIHRGIAEELVTVPVKETRRGRRSKPFIDDDEDYSQ